jgi:hypothetical protein
MKSIKPGRGPSALGAVGSIAVGVFGVFWTIGAASMGAPSFFVLFGVVFVGLAIIQGIFHFKNATGKNRMSLLDITDKNAEPDPLDNFFVSSDTHNLKDDEVEINGEDYNYCPFCGNEIDEESFVFCTKCGKQMKK